MDRIEYKEGVIWCGEEKASNQLSTAKRTKHGSSCIAEIEATGKASIKWCEKYRPP